MKEIESVLGEKKHDFDSLCAVMKALRGEGGCPWDREQTHKSVRKCLIEETYEVCEAIDTDDPELLCEELGDLIFQAVFHAQIEAEKGVFSIDEVVDGITAKMISRHPHVFGSVEVKDSGEVLKNWDAIKKEEKHIDTPAEALRRVPPGLPALLRAQKIQGKAHRKHSYGFSDSASALAAAAEELSRASTENEKGTADSGKIIASLARCVFDISAAAEFSGADLEAQTTAACESFLDGFDTSQKE